MQVLKVSEKEDRLGIQETYEVGPYLVKKREGWTKDRKRPRRIAWLAIKRMDDSVPLHDWRHLQQIKNLLCGPECEGVEIYPPESELVDANDNFHLWVYLDRYRMPFGFRHRVVVSPSKNPPNVETATPQREFETIPDDAVNAVIGVELMVNAREPLMPHKPS